MTKPIPETVNRDEINKAMQRFLDDGGTIKIIDVRNRSAKAVSADALVKEVASSNNKGNSKTWKINHIYD